MRTLRPLLSLKKTVEVDRRKRQGVPKDQKNTGKNTNPIFQKEANPEKCVRCQQRRIGGNTASKDTTRLKSGPFCIDGPVDLRTNVFKI